MKKYLNKISGNFFKGENIFWIESSLTFSQLLIDGLNLYPKNTFPKQTKE